MAELLKDVIAPSEPNHLNRPSFPVASRRARSALQVLTVAALVLGASLPAHAWGRKTRLTRKFPPGETMVYETKMQTRATVSSNPSGLKSFLPPVPTELNTQQKTTTRVQAVHPDGSADVEVRFDEFEIKSDILALLAGRARESAQKAQQEFARKLSGHAVTAHYDREGRLLGFDGADEVLDRAEVTLREPLRQILHLFLDQVGGNALYPDHPVKRGEEWKRTLAAQPSDQYPLSMEGENTLRYVGKTKYRRVKAAVIDFHFTNVLKPALESLRRTTPLGQLEALGMALDIRIDGEGKGRVLLALADGRILQNRSTIRQTLRARLKAPTAASPPASQPLMLEITTDTTLEVDGSGK